jgi:acyl-CoA thioester hydrolase
MHGKPHLFEFLVRESHLDSFGHVNNAAYLKLYEEARWEMITERGYGLAEVIRLQRGPVILEVTCKFRRELRLRETITIETRTTSYRGKFSTLNQRMVNREGAVCSEADFKFGLFDTVARRLVSPSPEWLRALGVADVPSEFPAD